MNSAERWAQTKAERASDNANRIALELMRTRNEAEKAAAAAAAAAAVAADPLGALDKERSEFIATWKPLDPANVTGEEIVRLLKCQTRMIELWNKDCHFVDGRVGEAVPAELHKSCITRHIALLADGNPNYDEAAKRLLSHIQRQGDFVCAMSGTKGKPGGRPLRGGMWEGSEAPPCVVPSEDLGYCALRHMIEDSSKLSNKLVAKFTDAGIHDFMGHGDVLFPFSCIHRPPRDGKSMLAIAVMYITLCMLMNIMLNVAPGKISAIKEFMEKIENISGMAETGILKLGTTLIPPGERQMDIDEFVNHHISAGTNCLISATEMIDDQYLKIALHSKWKELGKQTVHIWDEPDLLIKADRKDGKDTVLTVNRPLFKADNGYHWMVGATLITVFQERAILGTLQLKKPLYDAYSNWLPSFDPATRSSYYKGRKSMKEVKFAEGTSLIKFTPSAIADAYKTLYNTGLGVCLTRERGELARLQAVKVDAISVQPHLVGKPRKNGTYLTADECRKNHQGRLVKTTQRIKDLEAKKSNPSPPPDTIKPRLPPPGDKDGGLVTPYIKMTGTAILFAYIKSYICDDTIHISDDNTTVLLPSLVLAVCGIANQTATDPAGGMTAWSVLASEIAVQVRKPTAILEYTNAVTGDALGNYFGLTIDKSYKKMNKMNPVTLFLVIPVVTDVSGSVVEYKIQPVRKFENAQTAVVAIFNEYNLSDAVLSSLRVLYVGYDMFKAALTLTTSNGLILECPDKMKRDVVVAPAFIAHAHAKGKQKNTVYQTIARGMNSLAKEFSSFMIDFLSHEGSFSDMNTYAKVEEVLHDMLHGDIGPLDASGPEADEMSRDVATVLATLRELVDSATAENEEDDDEEDHMPVNAMKNEIVIGYRRQTLSNSIPANGALTYTYDPRVRIEIIEAGTADEVEEVKLPFNVLIRSKRPRQFDDDEGEDTAATKTAKRGTGEDYVYKWIRTKNNGNLPNASPAIVGLVREYCRRFEEDPASFNVTSKDNDEKYMASVCDLLAYSPAVLNSTSLLGDNDDVNDTTSADSIFFSYCEKAGLNTAQAGVTNKRSHIRKFWNCFLNKEFARPNELPDNVNPFPSTSSGAGSSSAP